jgi:hypothetical protein
MGRALSKTKVSWRIIVISSVFGAIGGFCGQFIFDFFTWKQSHLIGCVWRDYTMAEYIIPNIIDRTNMNALHHPPIIEPNEIRQKRYVLRRQLWFFIWLLKRQDVIQSSILISAILAGAVPFILISGNKKNGTTDNA